MKTCLLCSTEHDDDAATCVACGEATWGESSSAPAKVAADDSADAPETAPRARKAKR